MARNGWVALAIMGGGALCSGSSQDAMPSVEQRDLPSVRGEILDRHGVPLAENRAALHLYLRPHLYDGAVRARLIGLLDLAPDEVAELDRRAGAARHEPAGRAVLVVEDVGRRRAARLERARGDLGGAVEVHLGSRRHYPFGELAAHLIGYASQASPRELAEIGLPEDAAELVGRRGLEASFESWLRGEPGIEHFVVGPDGDHVPADVIDELAGEMADEPTVPGHDLLLTVDVAVQRVAARAVRHLPAAAVVVAEVDTGRILALVSTPSFDPDRMTGRGAREELALERVPTRPLLDRSVSPYAPGSTFKVVTAIAGLENDAVTPDEEHTCTGSIQVGKHVLRDMEVHGTVDFIEALQVSCNVYFWTVAERVGIERIGRVARELGFGVETGLGLNGESAGAVPDRLSYVPPGTAGLELTLRTAIGNGDVRVTPVQLAMAYAAIVNGGRLLAPQLVWRIQTARGEVVEERAPVVRRWIGVSPATLATVREGMWRAVNVPGGTGFAARNGDVPMIGKTGTALPPRGASAERAPDDPRDLDATHAWFVGLAPASRPELVVVVFVEHGGVGGKVAAPIARAIMDGSFRVLRDYERAARRPRQR